MYFTPGFITLACAMMASAGTVPLVRRAEFTLRNGQAAIALNQKFATLTAGSACNSGENACIGERFAQCDNGKFVTFSCGGGTICAALPLVNKEGTSITCTTAADRDARIAATGATGAAAASPPIPAPAPTSAAETSNNNGNGNGNNNGNNGNSNGSAGNNGNNASNGAAGDNGNQNGGDNGDPQTSLTLDPAVIAKGFANDGQSTPTAGQVASLTSTNNYINFCKKFQVPITDGQQIEGGSCNPAPMGLLPRKSQIPTSKFVFPTNGGNVTAGQTFVIQMKISNLDTGFFVNAQQNYYSAPQQLNADGVIQGHSHVVIQKMSSLDSTAILDPNIFSFFKGLNGKAQDGILTAEVTKGLEPGFYKLTSINAAANHQPVLAPVAQHGSMDDCVYFTVLA